MRRAHFSRRVGTSTSKLESFMLEVEMVTGTTTPSGRRLYLSENSLEGLERLSYETLDRTTDFLVYEYPSAFAGESLVHTSAQFRRGVMSFGEHSVLIEAGSNTEATTATKCVLRDAQITDQSVADCGTVDATFNAYNEILTCFSHSQELISELGESVTADLETKEDVMGRVQSALCNGD